VEFRALLYTPASIDPQFYDTYHTRTSPVKLYVKRVLVGDDFGLLPRYLAWVAGLVDSDTLPLSVSRETLLQHSSLKVLKKKLVRTRPPGARMHAHCTCAACMAAPRRACRCARCWR
jgi:heat shock protein 90kDa beta